MKHTAAFAAFALAAMASVSAPPAACADLERGRYLATMMVCGDCGTGGAVTGQPGTTRCLAGSEVGFDLPGLGIFCLPNLAGDVEPGAWSEDEGVTTLRTGVRPDGRELAPIIPWPDFQHLTDRDASALAAFVKSLPPVRFNAPGPFGPGETLDAPYLTLKVSAGPQKPRTG